VIRRLLVLAMVGLLAACGTSQAAAPPDDRGVLAFTGTTLDGKAFDAATLKGRPALLWFWAPWCATCAGQASSVREIQQEYAGKLGVLGVAGLGSKAEMDEFVTDLEIPDVRTLDDEAGVVWRRFGITQQSTYVLIDAGGTVVTSSYLDAVDLPAKVKTLVG
jgi:thiol-disulfide isomerase/thioredoxin